MYSLFTFYHQGKLINIKIDRTLLWQNVLQIHVLAIIVVLFQCQTWYIYYRNCDLGFDASNELNESSMYLQKILQKVSTVIPQIFVISQLLKPLINSRKPVMYIKQYARIAHCNLINSLIQFDGKK